jgi:ribosomal protein S18 acetylase RimI-like enzyme
MGNRGQEGRIDRDAAVVRRAGRSDVHAIALLWERAGLPESSRGFRNEISRLRRRDPELLIVARRDGRLVGAIAGSYDGRTAMVSRLAVDVAVRRQGIARALVDALCAQLTELGATADELLIVDDTPAAADFWSGVGFSRGWVVPCFVRRG